MTHNEDYEGDVTAGREEIAAILNSVADGLRTGTIRFGTGGDAVAVETPDELTLETELETEDGEVSLELELEWAVSNDTTPIAPIDESPAEPADEPTPVGGVDRAESLARFEVYLDKGGEWRWRLRHRNGNIIAASGEGYTRKHNAVNGLRSVVENAADAAITDESA